MFLNRPGGVLILANFHYMGLIEYLRDTKSELKHVSWPTRTQAIVYTVLVIVISAIVAVFAGSLDFLFGEALNLIIR